MRSSPTRIISWSLKLLKLRGDRRLSDRQPCDARPCNLGEIVDFTATGARIRCRKFFKPTQGRRVTIKSPKGIAGPAISLTGRICWVNHEDGVWHAGISLDRIQDTSPLAIAPNQHIKDRESALFRSDWSSGAA